MCQTCAGTTPPEAACAWPSRLTFDEPSRRQRNGAAPASKNSENWIGSSDQSYDSELQRQRCKNLQRHE
jgi:hypothetical protein